MTDLYLERIGLVNPTIVKRDNNGKSNGLNRSVSIWQALSLFGEGVLI